jgi:thiol-disulfide isomerase/thioredoxin
MIAVSYSEPLSAADLRGRVVLVDFGTYTCINWLRTLPLIRAWQERYRENGLVVVGIQTPEFEFEQNLDSVRREMMARRIIWPVAVDNGSEIWRVFNDRYWPALYFIDHEGVVPGSPRRRRAPRAHGSDIDGRRQWPSRRRPPLPACPPAGNRGGAHLRGRLPEAGRRGVRFTFG